MKNDISIGDTLFDTSFGMIEAVRVTEIRETGDGKIFVAVSPASENEIPEAAIGDTVFVSHAEATDAVREKHGRVLELQWDEEAQNGQC